MTLTREDMANGGRRSGEARRAQALERADRTNTIARIADAIPRDQIGPKLLQHAIEVIEQATTATITIETANDFRAMAQAAETIHKMARLEMGESTSNQATFAVSVQDREQRAAALRERLAQVTEDQEPEHP